LEWLVLLVLFALTPGLIVGRAAARRGLSPWLYGVLAAFFSWLGLLLLLLIDRHPKLADGTDGSMSDATLRRLAKLAELRDKGALTDAEFEAEKAKLR
jgi:hypothetical protein